MDRGDPVLISFFGLPNINSVQPPEICDENRLKIASLTDLAGMKAAVVQQRAEAKDDIDLDALIVGGISLPIALSAAISIYGMGFNPQITLKALSYFGDGDLAQLPNETKDRLIEAVAATDPSKLP